MKYEYERFDLRMTPQEREALEKLAKKQQVTLSRWVKNAIQRAAKRQGVW